MIEGLNVTGDKPSRWSYSSLSAYEDCPAKWKYRYMHGLYSPPSPAMMRGTALHSMCEKVLKEDVMPPKELEAIAPVLDRMKANQAQSEKTWRLDAQWYPTADSAWVKGVVDVHFFKDEALHIYDFKSGKSYPSHKSQLELYALIGLAWFPDAERVEVGAVYIDSGKIGHRRTIERSEQESLRDGWNARVIRLYADDEMKATPGRGCYWCAYKDFLGGPCSEYKS